jgi:hypothetical protein
MSKANHSRDIQDITTTIGENKEVLLYQSAAIRATVGAHPCDLAYALQITIFSFIPFFNFSLVLIFLQDCPTIKQIAESIYYVCRVTNSSFIQPHIIPSFPEHLAHS